MGMADLTTGKFGVHEPLKHGGGMGGVAQDARFEMEAANERTAASGRKAAGEERAVAGEERAVAGEERAVGADARSQEKHKFEMGKGEAQLEHDTRYNKLQMDMTEAAWEKQKNLSHYEALNAALKAGEEVGWQVAGPMFMAAAIRAGMKPSGLPVKAEPGTDGGRTGYFLTDLEEKRIQIDGQDWFVPSTPYEVKGKYVVGVDGTVRTYDAERGAWVVMGKDPSKGPDATQSAIDINRGLTVGEKEIDKKMAVKVADWGENRDVAIDKLGEIRRIVTEINGMEYNEELKQWGPSGDEGMTGGWQNWLVPRLLIGSSPDVIRRAFNDQKADIQDNALLQIQESLRATLGAQFTEKEAKMLFDRTFNPRSTMKETGRRLTLLAEQLETIMDTNDKLAIWMNNNRTMKGYFGAELPKTHKDFYLGDEGTGTAAQAAPAQAAPAQAAPADAPQRKTIGGKTYEKSGGQWREVTK